MQLYVYTNQCTRSYCMFIYTTYNIYAVNVSALSKSTRAHAAALARKHNLYKWTCNLIDGRELARLQALSSASSSSLLIGLIKTPNRSELRFSHIGPFVQSIRTSARNVTSTKLNMYYIHTFEHLMDISSKWTEPNHYGSQNNTLYIAVIITHIVVSRKIRTTSVRTVHVVASVPSKYTHICCGGMRIIPCV